MKGIPILVGAAFLMYAGHVAGQDQPAGNGADGRPRFLVASAVRPARVAVEPSAIPVLRRRVSLAVEHAAVGAVLGKIGRQIDVMFSYDPALQALNHNVTIHAEKMTLAAVLTEVLFESGLDVLISDQHHLALVPRHEPSGAAAGGTIVGRVTDAKTGKGIVGADIFLSSTHWSTVTDTVGRYRLAEVDPGSFTLTVRRLGYAKQSRPVTVSANREDTVDVALEAAAVSLDELVSTATGQQRRRDLGNAITTINADSVLQTAPIRSLTDLLQDRVPGLTVQHTSGAPGDPAKLRLRGLGSALRSNDPVVIVDGVRIYAAQSDARNGNLTNLAPGLSQSDRARIGNVRDVPAPSPLDQIDPNTIEKIEVFKGPSAATLYGADAANGVIVVTTKRGRPGPTRWTASAAQARTISPGQYPTGYYFFGHDVRTGGPEFCTLRDVSCAQDSLVQFQALNDPTLTPLGHGRRTDLTLTASGGTSTLTYSLTGSYANEIGLLAMPEFEVDRFRTHFSQEAPDWMRRPHRLMTWSVTSNVNARLGSSADITLLTSVGRSEQQRTTLEQQLAAMAGTYVDKVNDVYYQPRVNTTIVNFCSNCGENYRLEPTSALLQSYYDRQTASAITFTTGLNAQWRPRSWLSASGQAGLNVIPRDDQSFLPAGLVSATDSGAAARGVGRSLVSTFNVQAELRKPLGLGFTFTTALGANLKTENTSDLLSSAEGLVPGTTAITGARTVVASEQATKSSVYGWYVEPRISGQRLSFSTGLRLDGSSIYGTKVSSGGIGLPKLNGSWVISEEPWFPFKDLFSSLRLRGAYGQAQVQPGAADRLRLYTGTSNLTLSALGNTRLRPERSTEFEGGFDADLVDSRVSFELTGYRKLQVDALMRVTLPPSVGGGTPSGTSLDNSVLTNIGNIRNAGLDVVLRLTPVRSPLLTWSAELNYNRNTNILVKLGRDVAANKAAGLVEGYPLYGRWARPILGFADQNGDGVLDAGEIQVGDSLVFMGRLYPAYTTSLFTNLVLFGGAIGVTAGFDYNSGAVQVDQTARTNWVLARPLVDPSVSLAEQAAVWASTSALNPTDYGLMRDVSTFRFNSLSVNYRVPARVTRLFRAQQMSVAVRGSNLGLHSTYHGKDPDVNAWSPGENIVDTGQLPQPRTWQFQVGVTY